MTETTEYPEPSELHDTGAEAAEQGSQRKAIVLTLVALVIVLGALFGWRALRAGGEQAWQAQDTMVAAMVVERRDLPVELEAVGSLSAVREVMLSPEVAGRVSSIRFKAGDYVRSGALLIQLYDGPEQADRKAAKARADFAQLQLKRSEELAPTGAEPRQLLEERRAQYDQAQAEVARLDARIRQKQVRAPFSGRLGIRQADPGQYLNAGDPVASLTALDRLFVDFSLPQHDLGQIKPGQTVRVVTDAYPDRVFTARLSSIEPRLDEGTRNVRIQASLSNAGQELRPGMYVTAYVSLPQQEDAVVLPLTAIQTSAQGDSVIVIRGEKAREGGTAEVVPVRTGRRIGDDVVVLSGLKAGDVVVTEGQLRVQPGGGVKVTKLAGAEVK